MAIEAVNIARKYSVPVIVPDATRASPRASRRLPSRISKKSARTSRRISRPVADAQALRSGRQRRHHAARQARHADSGRQISHRHRPGTRRIRPSDRLAEIAHADDRQAPQEIAGARPPRCRCRKFTARRKATSCSSAGVPPKARSARPWTVRARPATAFPRFTCGTSTRCRTGLENIFSGFNHIFVVEMNDEGLYGYGQLGALLRARYCDAENPGHQQNRRPHLEGEGNRRTRQKQTAQVNNFNHLNDLYL